MEGGVEGGEIIAGEKGLTLVQRLLDVAAFVEGGGEGTVVLQTWEEGR